MLKYYLIHFVRNLLRQKMFSFINLLGLTVSIGSTLLIYLYVRHEFSYDRFHKNADWIYRVNQTFIWSESNNSQFASTGPGVAHALKEELAEVELITSIHTPGKFVVSYTNDAKQLISFEEENMLAADSNFFSVFDFTMIKGNRETALREANAIVMTESIAHKYFGNEEPLGKLIRLGTGEDQKTYEVTGIVNDCPDNTYIKFDALLSMTSFPAVKQRHWSWVWTQLETYVLLDENTDIEDTRAKLEKIPRKRAEETLQRAMNTTYDDYIKSGKKWELFLQPLTSIHLPDGPVNNRLSDPGNLKIMYALIGAALFIILLSCVNFMNLSTAQFTRRIKEASIRKVLGLGRPELSIGYFVEALIFCLIALAVALMLTQLLLPGFNSIINKTLEINLLTDAPMILGLLGLVLLMALISGSYPALFLSSFQPVEAMKGKLRTGGKFFRNGLVVFQFGVSIVLMICTAVVFQQLNSLSEKDLGFDKENLLVIKHVESVKGGESMSNAVLNVPGVLGTTWCTSLPPTVWGGDAFKPEGIEKNVSLNFTTADERFIPTLGIQLKAGRNFSADAPGDADRVILNKTALKRIGWTIEEALGKKIEYPGSEVRFEVVGIVEDFNYWSLDAPVEPMAIFNIKRSNFLEGKTTQFIAVRVAGQSSDAWNATFAGLNKLWKDFSAEGPFQYEFVDQAFAATFKTQEQFGSALTIMAGLAILIACLGLLGMIVYTLEQRTKEIGIRKVSGASAWNILTLISTSYTRLIVIAFLLSAPLSYWMMEQWLKDFTYKITPSPLIFVVAGIGTLAIAILITSYHSMKAAHTNPVDVLRDE